MRKNINYCIDPIPLLFMAAFFLRFISLIVLVVLLIIVIVKIVKSRKKKESAWNDVFRKILLGIIFVSTFLFSPFMTVENYLLGYVLAFAVLFAGLIIAKRKGYFEVKSRLFIIAGLLFALFFGAYVYKLGNMSPEPPKDISTYNPNDSELQFSNPLCSGGFTIF